MDMGLLGSPSLISYFILFTLVDLFETTRIKGLAKMDCIADEAAIVKELL